ncbi:phosphotransferase [Sphingomonas sp.]|uniref:phosphotransferase n=1 Tax=Sphingomonas sp. TaxID=28214 RepID=UPI003CC52874
MREATGRAADRAVLERALPGWLAERRWFGGKGEAGLRAHLLRATPLPGADGLVLGAVRAETCESAATYAVPTHADRLSDGFTDPGFVRWVVARLAENACVPDGAGELRCERFAGFDLAPGATVQLLSAEQSNSSAVLGGRAVLKLLRKLAPGAHPEVEMARYLTQAGFDQVPPVLGTVTRVEGDERCLVMLVQRFVPNRGDGWSWTLAALADGRDYGPFARRLGERLAAMHAVLAQHADDSAFEPEPLDAAGAAALGARVTAQVTRALAVHPMAAIDRDELCARATAIAARAEGQCRTRIHGDLHLGQLLVTEDADVVFIDFEGEPTRSLAERRTKDVALRDVAGVLRSFDYAEAKAGRTDSGFRARAEAAFLAGYGVASHPLLLLFLLEKAAYEVTYEAANRPDWVDVPAHGLRRIAAQLLEEG